MGFRDLLTHRAKVMRAQMVVSDGLESYDWVTVASRVRCRVDLQYIRPGRDPQWTPEAGRQTDRTGVAFFEANAPVKVGDRVVVLTPPGGTFLVEGSVDAVLGRDGKVHHLECGVREVPGPMARVG
jgi:hypothetical protein